MEVDEDMIKKGKKSNLPANYNPENRAVSYDPWSEMDRWFDDFRSHFFGDFGFPVVSPRQSAWNQRTPAMDVADLGDKYEMTVELPGIPKENIEVELTRDGIEISANYVKEQSDDSKNWLHRERSEVSFHRCLRFPEEVMTDSASASMDEGVLRLLIPKQNPLPESKPRKLEIK